MPTNKTFLARPPPAVPPRVPPHDASIAARPAAPAPLSSDRRESAWSRSIMIGSPPKGVRLGPGPGGGGLGGGGVEHREQLGRGDHVAVLALDVLERFQVGGRRARLVVGARGVGD